MRGRIDHAAEARKRIVWGEEWMEREGDTDVTNTVVAMHAQVHATLALVEQQRIANLIALGQFRVGPDELPPFRHLVMRLANASDVEPTTDIAAALGIGDDDE